MPLLSEFNYKVVQVYPMENYDVVVYFVDGILKKQSITFERESLFKKIYTIWVLACKVEIPHMENFCHHKIKNVVAFLCYATRNLYLITLYNGMKGRIIGTVETYF